MPVPARPYRAGEMPSGPGGFHPRTTQKQRRHPAVAGEMSSPNPEGPVSMTDQPTPTTESAGKAWPPPWELKPTYGEPHDSSNIDGESIGWDLSFGFRLNVDHDVAEDANSPLTVNAHFSDADLARGFVQREVRPDQLEEFARLLLNLAAKHKQRTRAARPTCVCCGSAWPHVPSSERCTPTDISGGES